MQDNQPEVQYWLDELASARKRDKDFRDGGEKIESIYEAEKETPFNILYSNTEVLAPAVYSQTPRPVVKRRYNDDDPLGKAVAQAGTRMLEYLIDTNVDEYEEFDDSMSCAVLDALLPGRGVTEVKYDAKITGEGDEEQLEWATICTDSKKWKRVYFGYALKWSKTPWIAFEDYYTKDEAKDLVGDVAEDIEYTEGEDAEDEEKTSHEDNEGKRKTALIYQIWDKEAKKVKYVSPQHTEMLKTIDDPLGITGFYPIPKPLKFVRKSNNQKTTALYSLYKKQAEELNRIQQRLTKVIEAIKVRGCYDGNYGEELSKIMDEDDNALIPTDKASGLTEGGLEANIWFMPITELVGVAQQLYQAREACKRVIYEITGVSDIIRGQSMASETLGAQKIKEAWGTMRLKNMQKDVQRYVRNTLRIMLDVASQQLPERLWAKMTGLPFTTEEQRAKAEQMQQALQQQIQQIKMQMGPPQPNQPPPQLPPQIQQQMQQVQAELQKPQWSQVLEVLQDDYIRSYKIDIETNSTLDVEATEDQQLVGDFMNAMAQFMNGMAPMIQNGTMPFGAAKSMLLAITRRFRFGTDVEDEIKAMQPPKQADPEQIKKMQEDLQKKQKQFEESQKQVGDQFDKKALDLHKREQELNYDREVFKNEMDFQKKLLEQEIRFADKMNELEEEEAKVEIKDMFTDQERKLQSMMDKYTAKMQNASV